MASVDVLKSACPTCGISGLPRALFVQTDMPFSIIAIVVYIYQRVALLPIWENTEQTRNATPYRKVVDFVLRSHISPIGDPDDV